MEAQILFVAPFSDLADLAKRVIEEKFPDKKNLFQVVKGDLKEAESLVSAAVNNGIEVIVSRGGTASLIEKKFDIPIMYIQVTITDILQAILEADKYPDHIAIAGFSNMVYGSEELEKILHIKFTEIILNDVNDAEYKIKEAVKNGIKLVVGDAISVKMAKKNDIDGIFIQSGRESIYRALETALLVASIRREEQRKAEQLRTVVNKSHDGIIAVNKKGIINVLNPVAEKIFHITHFDAQGHDLSILLPNLQKNLQKNDIIEIYDKKYTIKGNDIYVKEKIQGSIYTLQNISEVQKMEINIRKKLFTKGLIAKYKMDDIIGSSLPCTNMKRKAAKYALTESTILITGDSGTGKEMLVQSIHNLSTRSNGPFVAVNCAALPENLLESELFGYVEGAFTGAKKGGRQGLFELAHSGTLFLDEIGEMPLPLQSRILRVLQEKEVMPLGGEKVIPVDVRIVAATNKNLLQMVKAGNFREDLYYRLNILRIHMPTLQERKTDIPLLIAKFLQDMKNINLRITGMSEDAQKYLMNYNWPGNIRQFVNMMERIMLLSAGPLIDLRDVQDAYADDLEKDIVVTSNEQESQIVNNVQKLSDVEESFLNKILAEENFNFTKAAKRLGIHRTTLWRKLKNINNCKIKH